MPLSVLLLLGPEESEQTLKDSKERIFCDGSSGVESGPELILLLARRAVGIFRHNSALSKAFFNDNAGKSNDLPIDTRTERSAPVALSRSNTSDACPFSSS